MIEYMNDKPGSEEPPTREDIKAATKMAHVAMEQSVLACINSGAGPRSLIATVAMWETVIRVLDYARDRLSAEPEPETNAAFLARHGVGEWEVTRWGSGKHFREWQPSWYAITPNGYVYPQKPEARIINLGSRGDTTTPEGRDALDAILVEHIKAGGAQ